MHDSDHYDVDRIFGGPFLRARLPMTVGSCARAMTIDGRQKCSEVHNRGKFLRNYYTFESMHDGDHDGVVRIFVGLSCELGGFFLYKFM